MKKWLFFFSSLLICLFAFIPVQSEASTSLTSDSIFYLKPDFYSPYFSVSPDGTTITQTSNTASYVKLPTFVVRSTEVLKTVQLYASVKGVRNPSTYYRYPGFQLSISGAASASLTSDLIVSSGTEAYGYLNYVFSIALPSYDVSKPLNIDISLGWFFGQTVGTQITYGLVTSTSSISGFVYNIAPTFNLETYNKGYASGYDAGLKASTSISSVPIGFLTGSYYQGWLDSGVDGMTGLSPISDISTTSFGINLTSTFNNIIDELSPATGSQVTLIFRLHVSILSENILLSLPEKLTVSLYDDNNYLFEQSLVGSSNNWRSRFSNILVSAISITVDKTRIVNGMYLQDLNYLYQQFYNEGFYKGLSIGQGESQEISYNQGYDAGFNAGFQKGAASVETVNNGGVFGQVFYVVLDAPITFLRKALDFNFFGINFYQISLSLISISIIICLLKKFL